MMILPAKVDLRLLTAVSKFCGSDSARFYLAGVRVEIGARDVIYVATDGKRLLAVRREKLKDDPDNDLTGEFTIPVAQCRAFKLKADEDGAAELYRDRDEDRLVLQRGEVGISFRPIEGGEFVGRWIDWRHTLPRFPLSLGTGQFDYSQLATFQKFADEMSAGIHPYVAHNGRDGGALIRFHHVDAVGVVMPVKIDDQRSTSLPDWADVYWDRYARPSRAHRETAAPAQDAGDGIFSTVGDQAQASVDRLREQRASNGAGTTPANAQAGGTYAADRAAAAGDPRQADGLAADHQAEALASAGQEPPDAQSPAEDPQSTATGSKSLNDAARPAGQDLGSEAQANVDRLAGIKELKTPDSDRLDLGTGNQDAAAKPKRRGRRSLEERIADNTAATAPENRVG